MATHTTAKISKQLQDHLGLVFDLRQQSYEGILQKIGGGIRGSDIARSVSRICILASSSRGGTSVTAEMLQWQGANCNDATRRLLAFPGEEKPHLILAGLAFPGRQEVFDDLTFEDAESSRRVALLFEEMASEIGYPMAHCDDLGLYARQLCRRLLLQWPLHFVQLDPKNSVRVLQNCLESYFPLGYSDGIEGRQRVLAACVRAFPFIRASFYDCGDSHDQSDVELMDDGTWSVEETPFVVPPPWHNATLAEFRQGVLLLRDPSNAWRLPFWRGVFKDHVMAILHLARDPRESVQGLCDGWNYPFGFQTLPWGSPLRISGYTTPKERAASWKFHRLNFSVDRSLHGLLLNHEQVNLVDICAHQWRSAHSSILADSRQLSLHRIVTNFSQLRSQPEQCFAAICAALDLEISRSGNDYARTFASRLTMPTEGKSSLYRRDRWRISCFNSRITELSLNGYFDEEWHGLGQLPLLSLDAPQAASAVERQFAVSTF